MLEPRDARNYGIEFFLFNWTTRLYKGSGTGSSTFKIETLKEIAWRAYTSLASSEEACSFSRESLVDPGQAVSIEVFICTHTCSMFGLLQANQ